jgi:molybdate transport system substrate-binding protein
MRFPTLVFILTTLFSCGSKNDDGIHVAVASNAFPVLEELSRTYTDSTANEINLIQGSSGKLFTQISQGAPYDLFLSANSEYPAMVFEQGLSKNRPEIYAVGRLILWSAENRDNQEISEWLHDDCPLAIANPIHAPYGVAAMQTLQSLGLIERLKERLVYAENVSQCNQFIITQNACMGFSSLSTVKLDDYKNLGSWIDIDPQLYEPIQQGMVLISENPRAKDFFEFLQSDKAQSIFEKHGYHRSIQVQS